MKELFDKPPNPVILNPGVAEDPRLGPPFCEINTAGGPLRFQISGDATVLSSPDQTLDTFLGGELKILQSKAGYRFSEDTVLLSRYVDIKKGEKAIDLGTGCGILPLLLSQSTQGHSFVGVEIQKGLAHLARKNVLLNHLEGRITILHRDYRRLKNVFSPGCFDVVLANPPYRKYRTGRVNPASEKAIARHEISGTIRSLASITAYLLRPKGRAYFIFPAQRLVDLLLALRQADLEPKRLQFAHPRTGGEARFVLTESFKRSGVELRVMAPLILRGNP